MATIALIVTNPSSLNGSDTWLKNRLEGNGHTVDTKDDGAGSFTTGSYDAVVVSESINSGNVGWLKGEVVPVLTTEPFNHDEFDTATSASSSSNTQAFVRDATHWITQDFTTDEEILVAANNGANDGPLGSGVDGLVAGSVGGSWKTHAVDKNGTLLDSSAAAERRVILCGLNAANFTTDEQTLFDRAVEWVLYQDQAPSGSTATVSQTLPSISQSVTAGQAVGATVAQTLPSVSQSATGGQTVDATASQTLPTLNQSVAASQRFDSTVSQSLPSVNQTASGSVGSGASVSQTLPTISQSVQASQLNKATASQTLPSINQAAIVGTKVGATVSQSLPFISQSATGAEAASPRSATAAQSMPRVGQDVQASRGPITRRVKVRNPPIYLQFNS